MLERVSGVLLVALAGVELGLALAGCGGSGRPAATSGRAAFSPTEESSILHLAALANSRYPRAPAAAQTHPAASPQTGASTTVFTLRLTPGQTLGVRGSGRFEYQILIAGQNPRCTQFTDVTAGRRGVRLDVALQPATVVGWCVGAHRGTVLLEENPYCPPPPASGPAATCRLFAARTVDVGHFSFAVR